jgi:oligopeptide/dipeptide ABC transporter ATP-binding protein
MKDSLLSVEGLAVHFPTRSGVARAVDGIDLEIDSGRTLALVGESGCGKTVTALAIPRLVPAPGRIVAGRILWKGEDLLRLEEAHLRRLRGAQIAMVFQEPSTALDPIFTVGDQIGEVLRWHCGASASQARAAAVDALAAMGLGDPLRVVDQIPEQLSGGMRQRVALAMAMAAEPQLLIADEPTTALDVSLQAQVLDLIREVQARSGVALLLVTHDLGVVSEMAQEVAVMYAGKIVERASRDELFGAAAHPYTRGLLASLPRLDGPPRAVNPIPGSVPDARCWPTGCRFRERCPIASERCAVEEPLLTPLSNSHGVACHHPDGEPSA